MLGPWPDPADEGVQTGAWILFDERPLSRELETFVDKGEPPIYFGFGSSRAPQDATAARRLSFVIDVRSPRMKAVARIKFV